MNRKNKLKCTYSFLQQKIEQARGIYYIYSNIRGKYICSLFLHSAVASRCGIIALPLGIIILGGHIHLGLLKFQVLSPVAYVQSDSETFTMINPCLREVPSFLE